jgi:hypothetical protein
MLSSSLILRILQMSQVLYIKIQCLPSDLNMIESLLRIIICLIQVEIERITRGYLFLTTRMSIERISCQSKCIRQTRIGIHPDGLAKFLNNLNLKILLYNIKCQILKSKLEILITRLSTIV